MYEDDFGRIIWDPNRVVARLRLLEPVLGKVCELQLQLWPKLLWPIRKELLNCGSALQELPAHVWDLLEDLRNQVIDLHHQHRTL